jgi:hypothetical protein
MTALIYKTVAEMIDQAVLSPHAVPTDILITRHDEPLTRAGSVQSDNDTITIWAFKIYSPNCGHDPVWKFTGPYDTTVMAKGVLSHPDGIDQLCELLQQVANS